MGAKGKPPCTVLVVAWSSTHPFCLFFFLLKSMFGNLLGLEEIGLQQRDHGARDVNCDQSVKSVGTVVMGHS